MNIEMTLKYCVGCGKKFKVKTGSPQEYHSTACQQGGPVWRTALRKQSNVEEPKTVKEVVSVSVTPNLKKNESSTLNVPAPWLPRDLGVTTTNIKAKQIAKESKGQTETVSTQTENSEKIMQKTESKDLQISKMAESVEILPTDLSPLSIDSSAEKFHMLSLLDSSVTELHLQMKGMFAHQPKPEENIRTYEPEKVQTSCLCAKQITEMLRLKLDIFKAHKGLN